MRIISRCCFSLFFFLLFLFYEYSKSTGSSRANCQTGRIVRGHVAIVRCRAAELPSPLFALRAPPFSCERYHGTLLVSCTYLFRAFKKLARSLVSATRSIAKCNSSTFTYAQVQVPMYLFDRKRKRVMLYLHMDTRVTCFALSRTNASFDRSFNDKGHKNVE